MGSDTVFTPRLVTGRKNYQCVCCLQQIAKNTRHMYQAQVYEGKIVTFRMHDDCHDWEIFLNQENDLYYDDYMPLHEYVANEGLKILEQAPESVQKRFVKMEIFK